MPASPGTSTSICTRRCTTSPPRPPPVGESLDDGADEAADAFVAIQGTGRETLTHMRQVVGSLREEAPTGPQPVLAQLDRLLGQTDELDVRLQVTGDPRLLPPGLELSGYRIVEHLLATLEKNPVAEARVEVVFGADALEFKVVGPSVRESAARPALAAATERAHLHGGTVRSSTARRAPRDPGPHPTDRRGGLGACPDCGGHCRHRPDPLVAALLTAGAADRARGRRTARGLPRLGLRARLLRPGRPAAVAAGPRGGGSRASSSPFPTSLDDASTVYANATFISGWAAVFLYCYALGSDAPFPLSLLGIAAILVGVNLSDGGWNPVPEMVALGPYAGGLAVASRRRASAELELRARELEEEREIFATQSVRYERARIARELHDIVAHSVSLMVVQANAGERLAALDPAGAAEAFTSISEAAAQAEAEIDRLVELLNDTSPSPTGYRAAHRGGTGCPGPGLRRWPSRASCAATSTTSPSGRADAAYRMVQEGITNAMKHAPGAPMEVTIRGDDDGVEVRVVNGPAGPALGLGAGRWRPRPGRHARAGRPSAAAPSSPAPRSGRLATGGSLPPSPPRLQRGLRCVTDGTAPRPRSSQAHAARSRCSSSTTSGWCVPVSR